MAKDPKKPNDENEDFIPFQEEGALEIPDPADENEATISMNFEDMEEKVDAPDLPPEVDEFEEIQTRENTPTDEMVVEENPAIQPAEGEGEMVPEEPQSKRTQLAKGGELQAILDEEESHREEASSPKRTMLAPAGMLNELEGVSPAEGEGTVPEEETPGGSEDLTTLEEKPARENDEIDDLIDDVPAPQMTEGEAEPEDVIIEPKTEDPVKPPRKRGGMLVGTMVGMFLGALGFGGLYEFGIEIPQNLRMNKSQEVIALENGKKKAESDATAKAKSIADLESDAKKQLEDFASEKKKMSDDSEKKLAKADADAKSALKLADEKSKAELVVADKKLTDLKVDADKTLKETMAAAKKAVDDTKAAADKAIADEKKDALAKLDVEAKKLAALQAEKTKVDMTLAKAVEFQNQVAMELAKANLVKEKADQSDIKTGLQEGLKIVQAKDPQGMIRDTKKQFDQASDKLAKSRQPAEMLDYWRNLVDSKLHPEMEKKAAEDAAKVLVDGTAKAEDKTRAQILQGVILRNQGKYNEAKAVLEKSSAALPATDTAFKNSASLALAESRDPVGHYLALSKKQETMNLLDEAVASMGKALSLCDAFAPNRKGDLLANSSLMKLERALAKSGGAPRKDDPIMVEAAREADEAVKSNLAVAHYAKGRIAEVRGQVIPAIESFRKAVDANPKLDAQGVRYRASLMRMLNGTLPEAVKSPVVPAPRKDVSSLGLESILLISTSLYFQVPEAEIADKPKISPKEAQDLADAILKSPDASFEEKAQAYGTKGYWSKALKTYVEGLRGKIGPIHAENLNNLLKNHPGMEGISESVQNNPLEAERFFGSGLALYFNKRYFEAEKAFLAAVEHERQDARYHYYLGLARLAQKKPEAVESFEFASMKERQGKPNRAAVSKSLERVQGSARLELNRYRNAPVR